MLAAAVYRCGEVAQLEGFRSAVEGRRGKSRGRRGRLFASEEG